MFAGLSTVLARNVRREALRSEYFCMTNTRLASTVLSTTALATAACAIGVGLAPAASATPPDGATIARRVLASRNPAATYRRLPAAKKRAMRYAIAPTRVRTRHTKIRMIAQGNAACWQEMARSEVHSAAGITLYSFWQATKVCTSKNKVVTVSVIKPLTGAETSTLGWRLRRGVDVTVYNAGWEGRGLARFAFVFGAGGWNLLHPTNCLQQRLNADHRNFLQLTSCNLG